MRRVKTRYLHDVALPCLPYSAYIDNAVMNSGEGSQTMQATVNTNTSSKQFGFNRFGTTMMALGIAAGIAIGAAGGAIVDNLPAIDASEKAIVLPKAHSSVNQGNGLVAGTSAIPPAVRAHTSVEQGNGILGGNLAVPAPLKAHTALGQGEGIIAGLTSRAVLTNPVKAYDSAVMGEGWATLGRPTSTLQAHTSAGQGEGWVSNGRP